MKEKVVDLLLGLMSSHDIRYQHDKRSLKCKSLSRIALMYLPLLSAVTADSSFLNLLQLDFENSNDASKTKLFNNENDLNSYATGGCKSKRNNVYQLLIKIILHM